VRGNVAGSDLPKIVRSRGEEMEVYDSLPDRVRRALASASVQWDAAGARHLVAEYGEDVALKVLAKAERDLQNAYLERIAA